MMSHWMIEMMVLLDGQNEKLDSASFGENQFWTQTWGINLEVFQNAIGVDLLDLRFWFEGLQGGIISEFLEQ